MRHWQTIAPAGTGDTAIVGRVDNGTRSLAQPSAPLLWASASGRVMIGMDQVPWARAYTVVTDGRVTTNPRDIRPSLATGTGGWAVGSWAPNSGK